MSKSDGSNHNCTAEKMLIGISLYNYFALLKYVHPKQALNAHGCTPQDIGKSFRSANKKMEFPKGEANTSPPDYTLARLR